MKLRFVFRGKPNVSAGAHKLSYTLHRPISGVAEVMCKGVASSAECD